MVIRERTYKTCGSCGRREVDQDEAHGCDGCATPIDPQGLLGGGKYRTYLELTAFPLSGGDHAKHYQFCSWACVLKVLPSIPVESFATLPYLQYEADAPDGQRASDFFAALQALPRVDFTGGEPK